MDETAPLAAGERWTGALAMFATEPRDPPEVIAFFLVPNFSLIAFGSALEPLRLANRLAERELYRWHLVSKDGGPVRASNGVSVNPEFAIAEVGPGRRVPAQSIVLCAGVTAERYADREVFGWLHRCDRQGVEIGALCTGAHVLARAGLLDGYRCTIHWENLPGFIEAFPEIQVSADLFEIDRNRFTCSGGTAALDMMLHLIAGQHGDGLATRVSEMCLLDRMRGPHDHQRLPLRVRFGVHHPRLIKSIEMIEANLEEPLGQEELARYVGLSRRQLERLFAAQLGRTPARFYLERRLDRARRLLHQTDMPVIDVALACGFVSASHFSKSYRQMYGKTPRQERGRAAA